MGEAVACCRRLLGERVAVGGCWGRGRRLLGGGEGGRPRLVALKADFRKPTSGVKSSLLRLSLRQATGCVVSSQQSLKEGCDSVRSWA